MSYFSKILYYLKLKTYQRNLEKYEKKNILLNTQRYFYLKILNNLMSLTGEVSFKNDQMSERPKQGPQLARNYGESVLHCGQFECFGNLH